ncbi:MAG: TrbC/VirB2 family protein [Clostridia bacterium]|nr:TrbC/VirB2 family protein [Clostridia bacterium]
MKKLVKILPAVLVVALVLTNVFANISVPGNEIVGDKPITGITNLAGNVWATVITIVQILAIAAVVFAGLRYMFASADQKADIKKSMGILVVGGILVFAASTILSFVSGLAESTLGTP